MSKKTIYLVQFGTGTSLNLIPLASGQLIARLKQEEDLLEKYNLSEIIHQRPKDPESFVNSLDDVFAIGLSCSLWNINLSLLTAKEVRKKFPEALIVTGGPSIAKDPELVGLFFEKHPYVDVIVTGEGEDALVELLKHKDEGKSFQDICGIIYKDKESGDVKYGLPEAVLSMPDMPSPFLDGTFDEFYAENRDDFSGIVWETNRGCPFTCTFCTWGNYASRKVRYNSVDQIKKEIEWIGKNKIGYIALTDANFGMTDQDVETSKLLAKCKKEYGVPDFISVSWAKNSAKNILTIADIFREVGIGFRVTLTFQSKNPDVIKAINRKNIKESEFEMIRDAYHEKRLYSYTELIIGLPLETYSSFVDGVEQCFSSSVYDQIYIYPLFLFPNTEMSSPKSIEKYGLISKTTVGGYTKGKDSYNIGETVDMVIGTATMSEQDWVEAFVLSFFALGIHDDRLLFFVLQFLNREYGVKVLDLVEFSREISSSNGFDLTKDMFGKLKTRAELVQNEGVTHLMEPVPYGGLCFDPPQAVFLEFLYKKEDFYKEFARIIEEYMRKNDIDYDTDMLEDLFVFQNAVMAHPDGPKNEVLETEHDWVNYFRFTFNFPEEKLKKEKQKLKILDFDPSEGDCEAFLKKHFDVRGVPAFNELYDESGNRVFPASELRTISAVKEEELNEVS
ncbi:MAG: hypothetical protein CMM60_05510 [Rhodospirillaceae bacterium]|mgnify:CR=1 FL=1|jgi:putative methyltransferase|nr:hypothetical protein [Rhodospirillaceae bacterium]|tara:strand:- start:4056 stop:6080 length:2025 start_codon:yes stop_codon:yes gene_type:complete